jgi:hypothetical protein
LAYCPNCKYDYKTDETVCPDCKTALIFNKSANSSAATVPDDSWVVIAGIEDGLFKDMAKGSLDSNNIPSIFISSVSKEEFKQIAPLVSQSLDGIEGNLIVVPREFKDDAVLVLSSVLGDDFGFEKDLNFL